jgi:Lrp/AsnC family transcriptional regulator
VGSVELAKRRDVDYMLRVVIADLRSYDIFYRKLIGSVALKNVTHRPGSESLSRQMIEA